MTRRSGFIGRRNLLKLMGISGVACATTVACSNPNTVQTTTEATTATTAAPAAPPKVNRPDTADLSPDDAMKLLMDGHQRFLDGKPAHPRQDPTAVRSTGGAQYPFAAFLSCADSRVPVEVIFDQGVGDCFVTRVAGNIATPELVGSLEFGTAVLGAKILMVIGHERCGAVVASMGRLETPLPKNLGDIPTIVPFIAPAVNQIATAAAQPGAQPFMDDDGMINDVEVTTKQSVMNQVDILKKSPILSQLINEGQLKIVGAYYDLDSGKVTFLDKKIV